VPFSVLAKALAVGGLGVLLFLGVARYVFSADLGMALNYLLQLPPQTLAVALALRALTPLIHAAQFYYAARSLGLPLRFSEAILGVYSSLAMEYAVPVGGATEVYRVYFLARRGLPLSTSLGATFLHRLLHSAVAVVELAVICVYLRTPRYSEAWLALAVGSVLLLNSLALAASRSRRVATTLARVLGRFTRRVVEVGEVRLEVIGYLATSAALVALEKVVAGYVGLVITSYFVSSFSFLSSLLLYDLVLATFWLLPIVTPAGLGQVEAVQLAVAVELGMDGTSALPALILYRATALLAVLPQLLVALARSEVRLPKSREISAGTSKS
jgi:uncharacterized membrane protein YbhN (UPF0104 family)